ncbi:MAG: glycoside hydrolase family 38 C-terminal domain-containing protein [Devosia sp.]
MLDKHTGRQAIAPGEAANALCAFRDIPVDFDAWDIDASYEDVVWPIDLLIESRVVETGPHRVALLLRWRYEASTITQVLALEADARRLDIDCVIDWHEHQTLLKAAFPLAVRTDHSTAEIQFGHVSRPTHRNTSWNQARFETSMQHWVDLSEPGFGVALLNDCKYGYDAQGSTLRLTLVKSPVYPWPEADQGEHRVRYAVLLHDGDLSAVHEAAEDFNLPLRILTSSGSSAKPMSVVTVSAGTATIEAVKRAADGEAIVVRLWEAAGRRGPSTLQFATHWQSIQRADLLENPIAQCDARAGRLTLDLAPFEVATLLLGQPTGERASSGSATQS